MTPKRTFLVAALCGLAALGAGCGGDDNDTLSYDDTGAEIGKICQTVDFDGLNGVAKHDAPILDGLISDFEEGVENVRDLDVDEELKDTRDEFVDNADQQVALIKEAKDVAETGNTKAYRKKLDEGQALSKESDELASKLGASACIDNG
jgi:hypothetical protein